MKAACLKKIKYCQVYFYPMCMNSNFSFSLHLGFILFATHYISQGLLMENSLDMALLGVAVSLPTQSWQ